MRLPRGLGELTYCLNVHPSESWSEVRAAVTGPARAVKAAVCPDAAFALGLRLSAHAVHELERPGPREELAALLRDGGFRAVMANGFPYGAFHGTAVKAAVYRPDWGQPARLAYTIALAELMAALAPPGETVSLSTVPGAFRAEGKGREDVVAEGMLRVAAASVEIEARTGVRVALAVEPEPACLFETTAEAAGFLEGRLFSAEGRARFTALTGAPRARAEAELRRRLGLCLDVCHMAVAFEDPAQTVAALRAAGTPVVKLQLSVALRAPRMDPGVRAALGAFVEPVYLHQTVVRLEDGRLGRWTDLPEALAEGPDGAEWRVHFHVPVFAERMNGLETTRDALETVLALHRSDPIASHLEVETYSWGALPAGMRGGNLEVDIARELTWVRERLVA